VLGVLTRRWERAHQGDGQLVLVVGEPGLGKSRLIEKFHTRLREVPHTWVEWSSSQLLQNTPLHPVAEWGRMRFGGPDVSVKQRLADLENTLAQIQFDPAENVPLLAPLLDIPLPPEHRLELAPEDGLVIASLGFVQLSPERDRLLKMELLERAEAGRLFEAMERCRRNVDACFAQATRGLEVGSIRALNTLIFRVVFHCDGATVSK
jgi:predicted ATPase